MKRVVITHFRKLILSSISVFLILISCCFIFSIPVNNDFTNLNNKNRLSSLKEANYPTDISPINIDDNWTETEAFYDWCSGSGIYGDPFIIKDIKLNCKEKSSGLSINNSDKNYFVIQNCTFYNCSSFPAIILQNSNNGIIHECNLSSNNQIGIQLVKTDNCSFTFNTISYNEIGIFLEKTNECNFYKNNITHNNIVGVDISTPNSDLNLFYHNNFSNNVLNVNDAADNEWDNGSIGNYWDDYGGHDLDDDEIGDDPYIIDSDSQDNFPIWNDGDDINPTLTVLAPSNNTTWSTAPLINVSAYDINLDTIWYLVNDSAQITELQNETAEYLPSSLWSELGEGPFNISFYANDTAGNENDALVIDLYKDTTTPFISIISPINQTFWNHRPTIQVLVSDTHFQSVWYEINGQKENLTNGVSEILNTTIWESIPDESPFTINFYANDSVGNINDSYSLALYKDITNPTLSIDLPADGTYWNIRPNIQVTASDTNLDSIWYEVNGLSNLLDNGISELLDQGIWDSLLDEETFTILFYANDSAGNINSLNSRTIHKDISAPSLTIKSPDADSYWNVVPDIEATASDTNFDSIWYEVDGVKVPLSNGVLSPLDSGIWSSLSDEETFTINFFANDSAGNENSYYSRTIHKDILSPTLTIVSPDADSYWNAVPNIEATASDTNFDSIWYEIDGVKVSLSNGVAELLDLAIWSSLSDEETFTIFFFANDSAGNINSLHSRTIHKDITDPSVSVDLPLNNTYWNARPDIQVTVSDINFESVWYEVGGVKIILENGVSKLLDQDIWDALLVEETFTIDFFANDSAGNLNSLHSITIHKDVLDPNLIVTLPLDDSYWNTRLDIQATASDTNLVSIWYEVDGSKILLENGISALLDQGIWDSLSDEETFTIFFYANDSAGNINSLNSRTIHKDILNPDLLINLPLNNSYWNTRPNIQATVSDTNLDSVWYEIGGVKIILENGVSKLLNQEIWDALSAEETFTIYFYANDSAGNVNSLNSRTIHKDITDPALTVNLPLNDTYWNSRPLIQSTASDTNLDSIWYEVGGVKILLDNGISELLDQGIWDTLSSEESFTIYFFANDSAGNVNSLYSRIIHKDTTDPTLIVNLPFDNTYWNTRPYIQATVSDTNLDSVWYIVDATKIFLENGISELLDQGIWDSLSTEQTFTISFYANDSAGNVNSLYSQTIHKDTIDPILLVDLPLEDTYWNTRPNIQATASDINLDSIWYEVGGVKILLDNDISELLDQEIWDSLSDEESFTINFFANDFAGNINSLHSITIHKDIIDPTLIIDLPIDGTYWNIRPSIQATASDTNLDSIWYEVSGTKIMLENGLSELLDQSIWDSLSAEQTFTISFYANDSAGNVNSLYSQTIHKDTINPTLVVNLPLDDTYWNTRPYIQVTASDSNLDSVWYEVGGVKILLDNGISELLDQGIWDSLMDEETFTIYFFANDSAGNVNSLSTRTVHKDTLNPNLMIDLPLNDTYWNLRPTIQATASDRNFDSVWYLVDGSKILLENGVSELLDQDIWDALLAEETFTIFFYANDSAGNVNSLNTRIVHKDILNPDLTINLPLDDSYWNTRPYIQATASDTNLDSVWYEVDGVKIILNDGIPELLDQVIWNTLLAEETFTIYFYANDSAGNVNSLFSRTIHKDVTDPVLTVHLPLEDTYWNTRPNIQATATDINLDSVWYIIDGTKVILSNGVAELLDQVIWNTLLAEETFTIYFYANDSAGNVNSLYSRTILKDVTDPVLTVNLPLNDSYWNIPPDIQATASDTNLDSVWYQVNGVKISLENGISELLDQNIWNALAVEESFTIHYYANDSAGNVNSLYSRTIHKDVLDPEVTINLPFDGTFWNTRPNVQITVSDINFDSVWYEVDSSKILRENGISELLNQGIWNALSAEETFTIYFFANDSAGNVNSLYSRTIHKDITDPVLTVNLPLDDTYWNTRPNVQATASDINFDSIWYEINGVKILLETGISELLDQNVWDFLAVEESFAIYFYANDSAGNVNSLFAQTIHKDVLNPNLIVNLPVDNSYWNMPADIQATASDTNFDSVWYAVNGVKIILENGLSELLDSSIWEALSDEETFTISFFANDSAGNINSLYSRTIHKDVTDPVLTVNLPLNDTYWNTRPTIQTTASDINFDSVWYIVNGIKIMLENGVSEQLNLTIWNLLSPEETFTIFFYANDSAGNINSLYSCTLHKDTKGPEITITNPSNHDVFGLVTPSCIVNFYDLNGVDENWYQLSNGTFTTPIRYWSGSISADDWILMENGTVSIIFYANDSVGNIEMLSIFVYKDIISPSIIINTPQPYDLFGTTAPNIDLDIYDPHLETVWYQLENASISTELFLWTGSINSANWNLIGNGTVEIHFLAYDSVNNIALKTLNVRKNIFDPIITILNPADGTVIGQVPPIMTLYIASAEVDSIWYYLSNGTVTTSNTTWTGSISESLWNLFDDGHVDVYFYINDTLGNLGSDSKTIIKDLIAPTVFVIFPNNYDVFGKGVPLISIDFYDLHAIDQIMYQLHHSSLTTSLRNWEGMINYDDWNLMPNGTVTIAFYVNDTAGNLASQNITVYKDSIDPLLSINLPLENTYWNTRPTIQATATDPNFDSIWYVVNGMKVILENGLGELLDQAIWDVLSAEETFTIYFYANDTVGNINFLNSVTLNKDINAPVLIIDFPGKFTYWNTPPNIQVTAFDINFDSVWYFIDGNKVILENGVPQLLNHDIWDEIALESSFWIHFYVNDSAGNINSSVSIILFKDTRSPEITISNPSEFDLFGKDEPLCSVGFYDTNGIDERWYQLTNGITISQIRTWTGSINADDWDLMPNGTVMIIFFANDTLGNIASQNITVYKDSIAPSLIINLPLENTYWNSRPPIQALASDQNFDSVWYEVGNIKIILENAVEEFLNQGIWDSLMVEESFTIYFYANDTVGNINSLNSVTLNKDIRPPKITINLPTSNSYWNTPPNIQVTTLDSNFDSVWYVLDGTKIMLEIGISELLDQSIWDGLASETSFIILFYANDSAGNINSSVSVNLFKDTKNPEIIINSPSEFDLFGKNEPSVSINFYDLSGIDESWYQLTNGFTTSPIRIWTGSINADDWDLMPNGTTTIIFFTNDSVGNVGIKNVSVYKDIIGPEVYIYYPDEGELYGSEVPSVYFYLNDGNGISIRTYQLSNGTTSTPKYEWTGEISQTVWDQIRNGTLFIHIYATDTLGNEGSDFISIRKDTIAPSIDVILPQNYQEVGRDSPFFEVNFTDANFANSWYRIIGTGSNIFFSGSYGKIDENLWEEIWDTIEENEIITIRFYSNDTLGNLNYKDLSLVKPLSQSGADDNNPPPEFPIKLVEFIPLTLIIGFTVTLTAIIKKSRFYNITDKKHQKLINRILVLVALLSTLITISILIQ